MKGVEKLLEIVKKTKGNVVIMCSEKLWFKCHRKFISNTLVSKGLTVIHIIDFSRTYVHKRH